MSNITREKKSLPGVAPTLALAIAAGSQLPIAQAEQNAWLEEVVVTAQKRAESMQDVPIAMNAVTGDQLDALGIQDTDDVIKMFPNLSLQASHPMNTGVTIRGVGTANWHITAAQSVGQYMDEVSLFSPYTSQLSLFDMERVEVMRGPQNTLFGRNTTGGAVNYISRKPTLDGESDGYILTNIGNEGRIDVEGAVSLPLGENVAVRIAGQTVNRDGIWDNLFNGEKMGELERQSARINLLFAPSEATEVLVNGHYGRNRSGRTPYLGIGFWDPNGSSVSNGAIVDNLGAPTIDCASVLNGGSGQFDRPSNCVTLNPFTGGQAVVAGAGDWHKTYDAAPDVAEVDFAGAFVRISHEFSGVSLVSLTSYDELTSEYNETLSNIPSGFGFMPGQSGDSKVFSQELRLASTTDGSFRWIAGGYYSKDNSDLATIIYRTDNAGAPFGIVPSIAIDQEAEILSAYGQVEFDASDKLTFTLGLRYTDDSKEGTSVARVAAKTDTGSPGGTPLGLSTYLDLDGFNAITTAAADGSRPCPPPVGGLPCRTDIPVEQDLKEWGGKISADYRINDDTLIYASYSRGFKSGAFDTRALAAFVGTADQPTDPEFLDAFEVGFKSTLADGNLDLNGAAFFYLWEDRQAFDVDELGRVAFLNVPESELAGFELEAKWAPTETLYVQLGLGYLDTEITDGGTLVTVTEGAPLPVSPEWSFSGLIIKSFVVGDNTLSLQTDFAWRDRYISNTSGQKRYEVEESFQINARATYTFGEADQYEVALWAENITEEKICGIIGDNGTLNYQMQCGNPNAGMAFYGVNARISF